MMRPAREAARRCAFGAGQHAFTHLLRHKERTAHIGVHDEVVIFLAHVLNALGRAHARVVDENVDAAHLGLGMRHSGGNAVFVGHVHRHHMGVAACGLDLGAQILELVHPAAGQHHACTGCSQGFGKLGAQTAGCARHQGHAAGQIDFIRHDNSFNVHNSVETTSDAIVRGNGAVAA